MKYTAMTLKKMILFRSNAMNQLMFACIALVLFTTQLQAQHGCGTDELRKQLSESDPAYLQKMVQYSENMRIQMQHAANRNASSRVATTTLTIPVVVHIVAPIGVDPNTFVTDAQVITGIQHLNQAFANTGAFQSAKGVNTNIQFCLASQDGSGAYTTGITRTNNQYSNHNRENIQEEVDFKDAVITNNGGSLANYKFDPRFYVNIYLINEIIGDVAAYAWLPNTHGQIYNDGIINEAKFFGTTTDYSKVVIHEMGHYLGLFHTFEGSCPAGNCLTDASRTCPVNVTCDIDGDGICDTPPDKSTNDDCGSSINSCSTDIDDTHIRNPFRNSPGIGDQPDLISNYMDYGGLPCHISFTQGQANKMYSSLNGINSSPGVRGSLIGALALGCQSPCPNPLNVSFTASTASVTLPAAVSFTNTTTGNTAGYSWNWSFGDNTTATSLNASRVYAAGGTYTVKLIATNSDISCKREFSTTVTAICPLVPSFKVNGENQSIARVDIGQTVTLTNISVSGTTIQWIQDGIDIPNATANTYSTSYSSAGGHLIQQRISNGSCSVTSPSVFIDIKRCGGSGGREQYNWLFGDNLFINFDNGTPKILPLSTLYFRGFEGTSIVSNADGKLLIYTDANNIMDREGRALTFISSTSNKQILAFQHPNKAVNKIYVFGAVNPAGSSTDNFKSVYTVIDMNAGATGADGKKLGQATIIESQFGSQLIGEGVTALKTADGAKIFVIFQNKTNGSIIIYTVDQNGFDPAVQPKVFATNFTNPTEYSWIKLSPDGKKLAVMNTNTLGQGALKFYEFDPVNGIVGANIFSVSSQMYAGEFSPDGSKFYCTNTELGLVQFDLNNNFSKYVCSDLYCMGIQLAVNGKIYTNGASVSNTNLHCIESPNAPGSLCKFLPNAIQFSRTVSNGLPNFLIDLSGAQSSLKITGVNCVAENSNNITYSSSIAPLGGESIKWTISNTSPLLAEIVGSNTLQNVVLKFYGQGKVVLKMEFFSPCGYQSVDKVIEIGGTACATVCPIFTLKVDAPRDLNILGKEVFDVELNTINGEPINNFTYTVPPFTGRPFVVESTTIPQTVTFIKDGGGQYLPVKGRVMGRYVTSTYGAFKQEMNVSASCIPAVNLPLPDPDMNIFLYGKTSWQVARSFDCVTNGVGSTFDATLGFTRAVSDVTKIDFEVFIPNLEPFDKTTLANSFTTAAGTLSNLSYNSVTNKITGTLTFTVKSDLVASDSDGDPFFTNSNLLKLKLKVISFPAGGCFGTIGSTTNLTLKSATGTFAVAVPGWTNNYVYYSGTATGCGCVWPDPIPCTGNCTSTGTPTPEPRETRSQYTWTLGNGTPGNPTTTGPTVVPDPLTGISYYVFGTTTTATTNTETKCPDGSTGSCTPPPTGNYAPRYDGVDDYAEIANYPEINLGTGNYTLEAWINAEVGQTSYPMVLSKRSVSSDGFLFGLFTSGKPFIQMSATGNFEATPSADLRDGTCHHIAISREGTGILKFYVDGALIYTQNLGTAAMSLSSPGNLRIGQDLPSPANTMFKGKIEEIRMWNFARTPNDVLKYHNKRLTGIESGLVGYWLSNETGGQYLINKSPYSNAAVLGSTSGVDTKDPVRQASCVLTQAYCTTVPNNFVTDGTFENNATGWNNFQINGSTSIPAVNLVSTQYVYCGQKALKVNYTGTSNWMLTNTNKIAVVAGDKYILKGYVKGDVVSGTSKLGFISYNSTQAVMSFTLATAPVFTVSNGFTEYKIEVTVPAGVSYIGAGVTGTGANTLHFDNIQIVKSGATIDHTIDLGTIALGNTVINTQNNAPANGFGNEYGQPSDDIFYKFTITQNSKVTIDHCGTATTFDTYVYLFRSKTDLLEKNDDNGPACAGVKSSIVMNLPAGTYYVASEGYGAQNGTIATSVKVEACTDVPGNTKANPIIAGNYGTLNVCYPFTNTRHTACSGNDYVGQASEDIYYKFAVNGTNTVEISTCGSGLDTYLTLLDVNGNKLAENDDNGPLCSGREASISMSLTTGTYYVVSEAYSSGSGWITTKIQIPTTGTCRVEEPIKQEIQQHTSLSENLKFYPNPTSSTVTVEGLGSSSQIRILDMNGRVLLESQQQLSTAELDLRTLPAGMYLLQVQSDEQMTVKKLEVMK